MLTKKRIIPIIACFVIFITCATPAHALTAIDVASYQTGIHVGISVDIVIAKATEGAAYTNPDFRRVMDEAARDGRARAAYHFARTDSDPHADAVHFVAVTRSYIGSGVLPVLDWEPAQPWRVDWALAWLHDVELAYGVKPLIYMNLSTEASYDWSPVVAGDYGLWIAGGIYYNQARTPQQVPTPYWRLVHWPMAALWQYTSHGRVPGWGGNVDLSIFYGDRTAWDAYTHPRTKPQPAPLPPAAPAPVAPPAGVYVVQDGDCLSVIAACFGVSWQQIAVSHGIRPPYTIYPGQQLRVGMPVAQSRYTVKAGDTLSSIAVAHGVSVQAITGYASGDPDVIYPGEVLHW